MSYGIICLNCRQYIGRCHCGNMEPSVDAKTPAKMFSSFDIEHESFATLVMLRKKFPDLFSKIDNVSNNQLSQEEGRNDTDTR